MPNPMTECQQLISNGIAALIDSSTSPEIDAELLLSSAIGQTRSWLLAYQDAEVSEEDEAKYWDLIKRRVAGEPMAYIFGEREFWSLNLEVSPSVLIPRPDTEVLVEQVLEMCKTIDKPEVSVVDLGTGSGAIAIALQSEFDLDRNGGKDQLGRPVSYPADKFTVSAVDQSDEALELAKKNAETNKVSPIEFFKGFWFEPLTDKRFDMIVSNPPYIALNDPHLSQGDVRFEPKMALASGIDGLQDISLIVKHAPDYLEENGFLALEHGYDQALKVQALLKARGFRRLRWQPSRNFRTMDYRARKRKID